MKARYLVVVLSLTTTLYAAAPENKEISAESVHKYFWANYNQFGGKLNTANKWYSEIFKTTTSPFAYKGYLHLLSDAKRYDQIVRLLPLVDKEFEKDPALGLLIVQALEKMGQIQQADARIIKLSSVFPTNQEIAFHTAQTYLRRKEPENALAVIDKLLNTAVKKPNNFIFYFLKSQIYLDMNNKKQALVHVKEALELHPQFDKGWLLLGLLQEQAGNLNDAIKGYTNFLEVADDNHQEIEQHLLMLIFKQKIQQKNKNVLIINQSCFDKALSLFEKKDYTKALKEINECVSSNPNDTSNRLLKIQILSAMQKEPEVVNLVASWIHKEPNNPHWFKTLHILYRTGVEPMLIIKALEGINKKHPNNLLAHLYLADLYTRVGNDATAFKHHNKALTLTNNKDLKVSILFQISLMHYQDHHYDQMKQVIAHARTLNSDYPPVLNLLAYYDATYGNNLAEAQQLINTALKHDATNPYFLDTLAVVQYKKGEYDAALKTLKQVTSVVKEDFTILEHLGKTLYKKGKIKESIKVMEHAQQLARTTREKKQSQRLLKDWKAKRSYA